MPRQMSHRLGFVPFVVLVGSMLACLSFPSESAAGDSVTVGSVTIEQAWARPTDAMARTGAVYFLLKNKGTEPDRLVSVSTAVAGSAQLHTNTMRDGMVHMEPVPGIDIPANGSAELKPGGLHVMLMEPKHQLKPGQHFEMTLTFAKAGQVTIQVPVKPQAGMGGMDMDHGKMSGMDMKDDMGGMKH